MVNGSKCDDNDKYVDHSVKESRLVDETCILNVGKRAMTIDKSTLIKDRWTDLIEKQNKVNNQHEQRMKAITRIASSAKDSTIRIEKKVHRYNECRMNDIKDIRNDLYRKNDYILQKIQRTRNGGCRL